MSPKKPVTTLHQKCLKIIYYKLIYTITDEDVKAYKIIRKYITSVALHNLLKIMLKSENLDASIRFNCLQLLLTDGIRELDTGKFSRFYYDKILKVIYEYGRRLNYLNLKGVWVRDFPEQLSQVLRRLKGLKTLHIPNIANNQVIEAAMTLEKLVVLDISGEPLFTAHGLKQLKSESLQVLYLGRPGVCRIYQEEEEEEPELEIYEDSEDEDNEEEEELNELEDETEEEFTNCETLAEVLKNLTSLKSLKTYSYTGMAVSLLNNIFPDYKTHLKYFHDTGTTEDRMEGIVKSCPDLAYIHLYGTNKNILEKLAELSKLHTLKLTDCNIRDFSIYLNLAGYQLQVLKLNNCSDETVDWSQLCFFAPNLHTIEFCQTKVTHKESLNLFKKLKNLALCYCDISLGTANFIIKHSPLLTLLQVSCSVIDMTDEDIFKLCFDSKLKNIEKIWFTSAKLLTAASIEVLIEYCPKLVEIGYLDGWDLNKEEVLDLRALIQCANIDLTLLPK